jgi:TonB family protein
LPVVLAGAIAGSIAGSIALAQEAPVKITRAEAMACLVMKVPPDYPSMAKQLKMAGAVELQVTVSETGQVTKVEIVKGNPILTAAAVTAVKLWKFTPFLEKGKATAFEAPIEVEFKL